MNGRFSRDVQPNHFSQARPVEFAWAVEDPVRIDDDGDLGSLAKREDHTPARVLAQACLHYEHRAHEHRRVTGEPLPVREHLLRAVAEGVTANVRGASDLVLVQQSIESVRDLLVEVAVLLARRFWVIGRTHPVPLRTKVIFCNDTTMVTLPEKWAKALASKPETGMGYQVVSITLKNGTRFDQVAVVEGRITEIRGRKDIPFSGDDIGGIIVTHDKWSFGADQ